MPISKGQPFGGGAGVPDAASLFLNPAFWKMLQSLSGSTALPGTQKGGGPAPYPQKPDPPVGVNLAGGATPVLSDVTNPVAMGTGGLQVGRDNSLDPFGGNWTEGFGAKPGSPWVNKPTVGDAYPGAPRRPRPYRLIPGEGPPPPRRIGW